MNHTENVIFITFYIGTLYEDINDLSTSYYYLLYSLKKLESFQNLSRKKKLLFYNKIHTQLAKVLIDSDAKQSLIHLHKALKKAKLYNNEVITAESYLNIGWANIEIQNFTTAETYLDSAFVIFKKLKSVKGKTNIYLEKGILDQNRNKLESALVYFYKAYDILFNNENIIRASYFLKHKTLTHLALILKEKKEYEKSIAYGLENLKLSEKFKDKYRIALNAKFIGDLYDLNGQHNDALKYYKLSNKNFQSLENENSKLLVLKQEYEYQNGKNKKALSALIKIKKNNYSTIFILLFILLLISFGVINYFKKIRLKHNKQSIKLKEKEDLIIKNSQSITNLSLINQSKNQHFDYLMESLNNIYLNSGNKSPEIKKLISYLKRNVNKKEEWLRFREYHTKIEPNFHKEINKRCPSLSCLDIRHCTLIRLKLSIKESADVLGISSKSVQMARYRLKKKLKHTSQDSLKQFLLSL